MTTEQMDKINYLNQAYHLNHKINALRDVKNSCKSLSATSYENDGTKSYNNNNNTEIKYQRITDMSLKIDEELRRLESLKSEIFDVICDIKDDELETILIHRYLNFMSMEQIAEKMHYALITVQRKHKKAVDKLISNDM